MGGKSSLMLQAEEIRQIGDETGFSGPQIEKLYARFTHLDRDNCGALSRNDLLSIPELAINPLCERLIELFLEPDQQHQRQAPPSGSAAPLEDERRINFRQFMRVLAAFRSNSSAANNSTRRAAGAKSPASADARGQQQARRISAMLAGGAQLTSPPAAQEAAAAAADEPPPPPLQSDCLRDKLHFVFKIYDADNDGRISFNDLRTILKLMVGAHIAPTQLDRIATRAFLEVDRDHDGFIEFPEFCKVFAGKDLDLFRLSI